MSYIPHDGRNERPGTPLTPEILDVLAAATVLVATTEPEQRLDATDALELAVDAAAEQIAAAMGGAL